jgi:hypothetical protein
MTSTALPIMLEVPTIWCGPTAHVNTAAIHAPTQSLFDITDIPADISIAAANSDSNSLEVVFSTDEHRSTFTWARLDAHRLGSADVRTELAKDLRQAADLENNMREAEWVAILIGHRNAAPVVSRQVCVLVS